MFRLCLLVVVLSLSLLSVVATAAFGVPINGDNRPVFGILTLPCEGSVCNGHKEYFPASYVKYLESGGARVVPIHYTSSSSDMTALLDNLNGVLFTGGGASLAPGSSFFAAISTIYNYVVDTNKNGDYFPLWGTCLGFESLMRAQSQDPNILSYFNAENITLPLQLTPKASESRLFAASIPDAAASMKIFAGYNVTMNNHQAGVSLTNFTFNQNLYSFFDVLATNYDRDGREFVSLVESKDLPIYGSQFHPEKPAFEWWPHEVTQHTGYAVTANMYLARFIVDEARKNTHAFPSPEALSAALIYNDCPVFTDSEFVQRYFWA